MLFYIKCPSCSRVISKNLGKYQTELKEISNDPSLSDSQKNMASSELLKKYGYRHMCCRSRIMGLIPYHEIISS